MYIVTFSSFFFFSLIKIIFTLRKIIIEGKIERCSCEHGWRNNAIYFEYFLLFFCISSTCIFPSDIRNLITRISYMLEQSIVSKDCNYWAIKQDFPLACSFAVLSLFSPYLVFSPRPIPLQENSNIIFGMNGIATRIYGTETRNYSCTLVRKKRYRRVERDWTAIKAEREEGAEIRKTVRAEGGGRVGRGGKGSFRMMAKRTIREYVGQRCVTEVLETDRIFIRGNKRKSSPQATKGG